jgi:hypothetical protein
MKRILTLVDDVYEDLEGRVLDVDMKIRNQLIILALMRSISISGAPP